MPDSIDIDTQLLAHIDVTFWYITDYQKYTRTRHSPEPFFALYPMLLKRGGPVVSLATPGVHIITSSIFYLCHVLYLHTIVYLPVLFRQIYMNISEGARLRQHLRILSFLFPIMIDQT